MNHEGETAIPLKLIEDAACLLRATTVIRTPLIPLQLPQHHESPYKQIYLKLENVQPANSFKVRGACVAVQQRCVGSGGVCAASAGNFGQGIGAMALKLGVPCTILVPETIPECKLRRLVDLKVDVKAVPFQQWWQAIQDRRFDGMKGTFIHPCDRDVMAGHGTIGLEILEDLPDVDTIICPFGSGGLITGIASAVTQVNPKVNVVACEPETGAPLAESLRRGMPSEWPSHRTSFVDGMGSRALLPCIWPYVSSLVSKSVVVSLDAIAAAIRLLVERNCLVAEGAGAAPVAAALTDEVPDGKIVCVISGGNIDHNTLESILNGQTPA